MSQRSTAQHCHIDTPFCTIRKSHVTWNFAVPGPHSEEIRRCILLFLCTLGTIERLGESSATHNSQSASRSGVEAWVARNLNGWDDSDAGLSQGWVRCPSGLASLHHSRLATRSSYQLYSFSGDRRFCYDNHGSFVYDSPNLFCGPSGSVRTGLTGVRSEPGHRTHLTSLITSEPSELSPMIHSV